MRTKKISSVIKWAVIARPPGYIDILKKMSETWDIKKDEYTITDENWNALAKEYGNTPTVQSPQNDKCKFAVRDCCGKPHICSCTMGDCPDHFDKDCKIRKKYKG